MIKVTEARAARAHVVNHVKTLELFDLAAQNISANPMFRSKLNRRSVNERY